MEIEDLISIISSGVIVPVLGSDFCKVQVSLDRVDPRARFRNSLSVLKNAASVNNDPVVLTLNQYLAIRMADKSNFSLLKDEELNLSRVFLKSEFTEDTKYKILHDEYCQLTTEKQLDSYSKLAAIKGFQFYINTGPDTFLLDAFTKLDDRKPQFIAAQLLESNNNNTVLKEPSEYEPIVFNIFGSIIRTPYNDCAITDENYIELIVQLQEESNTQKSSFNTLFNFLKQNNLLIIGSSFPDWLMRFLIRLISAKRYTQSNQKLISDTGTLSKIEFAKFLKQYKGQIITSHESSFASPEDFINTLYTMITGGQPVTTARYKEKVFISFISDDRNIAELINKAFSEKGVLTFFDEKKIFAGTNFENVIKPEIQNCDYFLPVITNHSIQDRIDVTRYVYKEWSLAKFRRQAKEDPASTSTFIKPYTFGTEAINMNVYKSYFEDIGMEKIQDINEGSLLAFVENFILRNNLTPVNS
jgi:hypothetical protein